MHARLTFITVDPKDTKEVVDLYNAEIAPAVREFKGLKQVSLLEPTDSSGEFVSLTLWKSQADGEAYENSGTYRKLVDKFKDKFVSKPVLKTYSAQDTSVEMV